MSGVFFLDVFGSDPVSSVSSFLIALELDVNWMCMMLNSMEAWITW